MDPTVFTFSRAMHEFKHDLTPTASAGCTHDATPTVIKSPLARGDTASAMGPAQSEDASAGEVCTLALAGAFNLTPGGQLSFHTCAPEPPEWLVGLLHANLFCACPYHPGISKNECTFYCLGCTAATGQVMCKHCLPTHACAGHSSRGHAVFQVRRYMYQNVVHVDDLAPCYDVAGVQAYCINSRRAVLLQPKPPAASAGTAAAAAGAGGPSFAHHCAGCAVPLRPDCTYCSLKCKVDVDYGIGPATPGASRFRGPATAEEAVQTTALRPPTASVATANRRRAPASRRPFSAADSDQSVLPPSEGPEGASEGGGSGGGRRKRLRPARSHLQ